MYFNSIIFAKLSKMTLKETEEYFAQEILMQYDPNEANSIAKIALQFLLGLNNINYSLEYRTTVPQQAFAEINEYVKRLQLGEPIQYIIGEAHFMGFNFQVSPQVLIPRRETEELVALIVQENMQKRALKVLDVCTGSGCIAIALKKLLKDAEISAIDISKEALAIARENAIKLKTKVKFYAIDILETQDLTLGHFDVIVSNPPYVTESEKKRMHANVIQHEPHLALFVEDANPLIFYNKITALATANLLPNGRLYFEINEKFAKEVSDILEFHNFSNIIAHNDMQGKARIISGKMKN